MHLWWCSDVMEWHHLGDLASSDTTLFMLHFTDQGEISFLSQLLHIRTVGCCALTPPPPSLSPPLSQPGSLWTAAFVGRYFSALSFKKEICNEAAHSAEHKLGSLSIWSQKVNSFHRASITMLMWFMKNETRANIGPHWFQRIFN